MPRIRPDGSDSLRPTRPSPKESESSGKKDGEEKRKRKRKTAAIFGVVLGACAIVTTIILVTTAAPVRVTLKMHPARLARSQAVVVSLVCSGHYYSNPYLSTLSTLKKTAPRRPLQSVERALTVRSIN